MSHASHATSLEIRGRNWRALTLAVTGWALATAMILSSPAFARAAPDSFADLAEQLAPAVVNISTTQVVKFSGRPGEAPEGAPPGWPYEDLFKDFFDVPPADQRRTSLGSGFIIDQKGTIVTNNHVIADADEIEVTLMDGTKLPAKLVGTDKATDIAVLKVKHSKPLPAVSFGDSNNARVGDWVIAIGNPFNLGGTVTAGIISARNRNINAGPYDDFIQTDASINRGNSGGPLFDVDGRVVGVNTAIYSQTGGSVGIGFAVPSNIAGQVVDQLLQYGETRRGWLGVRIQTVTDEIAESIGMGRPRGALIAGVSEGGPAEGAGIKRGDIVLKFDGKAVSEMRELPRIVAETPIGKTVPVEILRDGKRMTVRVKVGQLESTKVSDAREPEPKRKLAGGTEAYGMTLAEITPQLRERYNLPRDAKGVLVTNVDPQAELAERVRPGDVIVEVDREEVSSPADVSKRIGSLLGKSDAKLILFLLDRDGDMSFVPVRVKNSKN